MYIPLILFFASLASIIVMIGRKFVLLKSGQVVGVSETSLEVPHLEKVKHLTIANIKKYEHIILEKIVRMYVKSTNAVKNKYGELKAQIKNKSMAKNINGENKEASKFLKIIVDYKNRVREMKHRIKKEENL